MSRIQPSVHVSCYDVGSAHYLIPSQSRQHRNVAQWQSSENPLKNNESQIQIFLDPGSNPGVSIQFIFGDVCVTATQFNVGFQLLPYTTEVQLLSSPFRVLRQPLRVTKKQQRWAIGIQQCAVVCGSPSATPLTHVNRIAGSGRSSNGQSTYRGVGGYRFESCRPNPVRSINKADLRHTIMSPFKSRF